MDIKRFSLSIFISFFFFGSCTNDDNIQTLTENSLDYCISHTKRTLVELQSSETGVIDYTMMPRNIMDSLSTWHCRKASKEEWCAGFWPGILWYGYEYSKDANILEHAKQFTKSL